MWTVFEVNGKYIRTLPIALIWCVYCELSADSTNSSGFSVGDFQQVNSSSVDEL